VQVNPKLAFRYPLLEPLAIRASVYRGFRAQTLDALRYNIVAMDFALRSNAQLAPETMVGGDGGLDLNLSRFKDQVNFFWNEVNHAITPIPTIFFPMFTLMYFNVGTIQNQGIEVLGEAELAQYWSASFGYTYTDSTITSNPVDPSLVGHHMLTSRSIVRLCYHKVEGLDFPFRLRANARIFANTDNATRLSDQFIQDFNVAYPIYKNVTTCVIRENILSDSYLVSIVGANRMGDGNSSAAWMAHY
jgi:outer membrane receptor protein involved in Fe transport